MIKVHKCSIAAHTHTHTRNDKQAKSTKSQQRIQSKHNGGKNKTKINQKQKTTTTACMQVTTPRHGSPNVCALSHALLLSLTRCCSAAALSLCVYLCVNCNASALIATDHETAKAAEAEAAKKQQQWE